jgi:hypothetical protein
MKSKGKEDNRKLYIFYPGGVEAGKENAGMVISLSGATGVVGASEGAGKSICRCLGLSNRAIPLPAAAAEDTTVVVALPFLWFVKFARIEFDASGNIYETKTNVTSRKSLCNSVSVI